MIKLDRVTFRKLLAPFAAVLAFMSGSVAFVNDVSGFQKLLCKAPGLNSLCGANGWAACPAKSRIGSGRRP